MFSAFFRLVAWFFVAMLAMALMIDKAGAQPPTYLPWQNGITFRVMQGNDQGPSHDDRWNRYAWDFNLPSGTPVLSAAPGRVAYAGWDDTGFGNTVKVCYADRTCSRYGHLSEIDVRTNQGVDQGQLLGKSGSTGRSSGPHLHYSLEQPDGTSIPSRFVEAGVPRTGDRVTSQNRPGASGPQFDDVHVYSSNTLSVMAGDAVTAVVTAHYQGPQPIPCGNINLGVRGDAAARFADYSAGWWPNSTWRSPNRVAAVGCNGALDPGEYARWNLQFKVPQDTPAGEYQTGVYAPVWEHVGWSSLQIPINLRVRSAYQAEVIAQLVTPLTAPGETGQVSLSLKNTGTAIWQQGQINLGTDHDQPFPFADSTWLSPNRISLMESSVAPGEIGHFTATFSVPAGTSPTRYKLSLSPVYEGHQWFAQEQGIYLMVMVGTPDNLPYVASDYAARWVTQTYVGHSLSRGDTAEVRVTLQNVGWATWFQGGPEAVHFRGIRPTDRGSGFIDPASSETVGGNQGVRLPVSRVNPGDSVTLTLPIKVDQSVTSGNYPEFFRLVSEGVGWFGPDGIWWPFTVN